MQAKNGTITWVLDRGRVTEWSDDGKPLKVTGTHIDMTKEKQYEQQLAKLANHDPLTGLANRHALQAQFDLLKKLGPLSIAFIDLDDFKNVNDTLGHRSGDEVLLQLSQRLHESCPPEVTIGRIGGDEFILLLPWSLEHPEINHIARCCLDAAITPFELGNGAAKVGASIGVNESWVDDTFNNAVIRADESMYLIKRTGKNGIALGARIIIQS
jgi:diguanylate cyclase (GGDEF)-like protein